MKYRIKEVSWYDEDTATRQSYFSVQKKRKYWPFWSSIKRVSLYGSIYAKRFGSYGSARSHIEELQKSSDHSSFTRYFI